MDHSASSGGVPGDESATGHARLGEDRLVDVVLARFAAVEPAFFAVAFFVVFRDRGERDVPSAPALGSPCTTRLYPTGFSLY